jgi:hypothetical protein
MVKRYEFKVHDETNLGIYNNSLPPFYTTVPCTNTLYHVIFATKLLTLPTLSVYDEDRWPASPCPAISYSRASWNRSIMQLALQLCVGHESAQNAPSFWVSSVRPAQGDS